MIDRGLAIDVDVVDQAQGHAVPEDTQMVAVNGDFVMLKLGEDDDLKGFAAFDSTMAVTLFLLPLSVLHVVSNDYFVLGSDAEMENDVLSAVE